MTAFTTSSGTRYEVHGKLLLILRDGVMECRADVLEIARVGIGQQAVLVTADGKARLTGRIVVVHDDAPQPTALAAA